MNNDRNEFLSLEQVRKLKELLDIIDTDNKVFYNTKKLILKIENDKLDNKKKD